MDGRRDTLSTRSYNKHFLSQSHMDICIYMTFFIHFIGETITHKRMLHRQYRCIHYSAVCVQSTQTHSPLSLSHFCSLETKKRIYIRENSHVHNTNTIYRHNINCLGSINYFIIFGTCLPPGHNYILTNSLVVWTNIFVKFKELANITEVVKQYHTFCRLRGRHWRCRLHKRIKELPLAKKWIEFHHNKDSPVCCMIDERQVTYIERDYIIFTSTSLELEIRYG